MGNIMVLGSISTDFVVTADRRPETGETITGKDFTTTFGGKGANQAVASARLGGHVSMVGTVGNDLFGTELIENLKRNRIDTSNVERVNIYLQGQPTSRLSMAITRSFISRVRTTHSRAQGCKIWKQNLRKSS